MNQTNQQAQVTLTLPVNAVEVILAALGKQPFEQVADLFMAIRQQAMSQLNPEQPTAPANEEQPAAGGTD